MKRFTVESNKCLTQDIEGFYSEDYLGFGHPKNPNYINILKNDFLSNENIELVNAMEKLQDVLVEDLPKIFKEISCEHLTVCIVPRSKQMFHYPLKKLLFSKTIEDTLVSFFPKIENGTKFITRVVDTKTTHFKNKPEYAGSGKMPYCGIALDTCGFSDQVVGKDILLIDDIYTKTVNIDEDMIQALLDKGAKSVYFYAIANTTYKGF